MPTSPTPDPPSDKPIVWHDHGQRVFVRIVCGECGARTRTSDLGPRFELAAVPNDGGSMVARRRIEEQAFGRSQVPHHVERAGAVSALAAEVALERAGLSPLRRAPHDIGPFAVLLCETQTMVRAWPGSTRLPTIELLFDASDPNPLAWATSSLRDTWAFGQHVEVATRAMQWWSWRPVTRDG